ncbi:MAG: AzlC family ABC transporter permease [Lachnospiraceae bacterium]|nr:AzlC family ABC transporter permease [Lachnospiraceae bacterium]
MSNLNHSEENRIQFLKGLRDGVPISLGYFAVAFSLGIAARNAGLNAAQASLASILCLASAGEFGGFTLIQAGAAYIEMAAMEFVINIRYMLMSASLSQKLKSDTPLFKRLLLGMTVTDEIFGISVSKPGYLNPFYSYGAVCIAAPGWTLGTAMGVIMGNLLPSNVVSALSVGLYGMFLAIIIPPARKNRVILALIIISMLASAAMTYLPVVSRINSGFRIIILTVVISFLAAVFFPADEDKEAGYEE